MKTIAQQLKIKDFPFEIKDKDGNKIYYENSSWNLNSSGEWIKREYDANGKEIYYEDFNGYWIKREYDANGKEIYWEDSRGVWIKREYDANGKEIYWKDSDGFWIKREYNANGNIIYWENSDGFWSKTEYNSYGNEIYIENSNGIIIDNRPKTVEVTLEDIAKKMGISVAQLRIEE